MLGDKQFFFGDEARSLDLITFVQIAILLAVDAEVACPLRDFINSDCQNLVGVYTRMKVRPWIDLCLSQSPTNYFSHDADSNKLIG